MLNAASAYRALPYYLFEFVKSYLYAVYSKLIEQDGFQVIVMTAVADPSNLRPQLVSITDEEDSAHFKVSDAFVQVTVRYNGNLYVISLYRERETVFTSNRMSILGVEPPARHPEDLLTFVTKQAVFHSKYHNACLEAYAVSSIHSDIDMYVRKIELESDRIADIYLPEGIRNNIALFIDTLNNYDRVRTSLRYLFSGNPGTGKTKLIRAIANECKGKASFIFADGSATSVDYLFEFADYFSPIVLCIDDFDLLTGRREQRRKTEELAHFLQKLDGFRRTDFFLLATTNDKQLVDLAASRPGRFDMIIDVSLIQPDQYASLIRSKTSSVPIVSLFDDAVLSLLQQKKVTGAFIANLVKHLELLYRFNPEKVTSEYLITMIDGSFRGFYKEAQSGNGQFGFEAA